MQGIKTSGAMRLRWYFRGKQAKKKVLGASMDAPAVNGKDGKPLLIWFRCKTVLQNGGGVLASGDELLRTHHRLQRRVEAASNSQFPIG